jgi:5'-methylthioadenosine/S-adenosylhomocysteine nucleosidase
MGFAHFKLTKNPCKEREWNSKFRIFSTDFREKGRQARPSLWHANGFCQEHPAPHAPIPTALNANIPPPALRHAPPVIVPGIPVASRRASRATRDVTLVLGAIPQESELVEWALTGARKGTLEGFPYVRGRIGGRPLIVAVTGIGKTNASLITTLFVEKFRPREVIMTGTASRINPAMRNGDVIVGEVTCNHDFGSLGDHYAMAYFGAEGPLGDSAPILYPADPRLLAAARRAIRRHEPEFASHQEPPYAPVVRLGRLTAGDQFGITDERIEDIRRQLQPDLMEMESGSVAQVCWYLRTPFLCIRSGSNPTQNSPDDAYRKLSPFAARQAALFTVSLVAELGRKKARP